MFNRLKIAGKLAVLTVGATVLAAALGLVGFQTMRDMQAQAQVIYKQGALPISYLSTALQHVQSSQEQVHIHVEQLDVTRMQDHEANIRAHEEAMAAALASYEATADEAELEALASFRRAWQAYQPIRADVLAASASGDKERAANLMSAGYGGQNYARALSTLQDLSKASLERSERTAADVNAMSEQARLEFVVLAGAGVVILLVGGWLVARTIARPLQAVARQARQAAAGDLTVDPVHVKARDEVGDMARAFNQMVQNLHNLVKQVAASATAVAAAAEEMNTMSAQTAQATEGASQAVGQVAAGAASQSQASQDAAEVVQQLRAAIEGIAAGAQDQMNHVQETSNIVTETVQVIEAVADKALHVADSSQKAVSTAQNGSAVVAKTVEGMGQIRRSVLATADRIKHLGSLSSQIGDITAVITEIADQTNLLALNAAIEAARAGEQGKGFAVVAEEVRQLAERAGTSAKQITDLIRAIQNGTKDAVQAMEQGTTQVEQGAALATDAGRALEEIVAVVSVTTQDVASIADSAQEIASASRRVAAAVDAFTAVSEENAAASGQMSASSDEVSRSVEAIAAVAAENAAATEEVSTAVAQISASASAIASSAQGLAVVARDLQRQVAQFAI